MLTQDQVLEIAFQAFAEQNRPVRGRIHTRSTRTWWFFGARQWHVWTNADCRGCNAWVVIDDTSGAVLQQGFAPR